MSQPSLTHHNNNQVELPDVRRLNCMFYKSNRFEFEGFLRTQKNGNLLPSNRWRFEVNLKMATGVKPEGQRHYDYDNKNLEFFSLDFPEIGALLAAIERPNPKGEIRFDHKPYEDSDLKRVSIKFNPEKVAFDINYSAFDKQGLVSNRKRFLRLTLPEAMILREFFRACLHKMFESYYVKNN